MNNVKNHIIAALASLLVIVAILAAYQMGSPTYNLQDILHAEIFTVDEPQELGTVYLAIGDDIWTYTLNAY